MNIVVVITLVLHPSKLSLSLHKSRALSLSTSCTVHTLDTAAALQQAIIVSRGTSLTTHIHRHENRQNKRSFLQIYSIKFRSETVTPHNSMSRGIDSTRIKMYEDRSQPQFTSSSMIPFLPSRKTNTYQCGNVSLSLHSVGREMEYGAASASDTS